MAQQRGETRENGWRNEQTVKTELSERRHDTARINEKGGRDFTEYKFGNRVGGPKTARQIDKDRNVLARDPNATGTWVVKHGALDKATRDKLVQLVRDFPGRFQVVELSRAEAEQARREGKALEARERSRQLELNVNVKALMRAQRVREAARKDRDRARTQEAAQRAIDARNRLQQQRAARAKQKEAKGKEERDKPEREPITKEERARVEREAAERVAREMPPPKVEARGRDEPDAVEKGGRDTPEPGDRTRQPERDPVAELGRQQQREAADRLAAVAREEREAASMGKVRDMSREVADLLMVARPTPGIESPFREPPSAGSTRGFLLERERERLRNEKLRRPGDNTLPGG
ncbi:hypothetical protein [Nocardia transvalensis]|uniref:hypothetical protein n=1 Tax=Nocardia transvalensis TaxID=37333 RepID=UPI001892E86A|nr:hypothetical protein [Nocardia transvalensis]MBF6328714.1 hypothetical protein [Nocardia transvalensis]